MTLEIQNASARAGGREIVHNLDLALAAGEIVAVVGPNGAGKSTLLKLACGLMPLHGGEIRFDGSKIGSLSAGELSRRRALLPQECPMRARFTALELVLMGTAISGQGRPIFVRHVSCSPRWQVQLWGLRVQRCRGFFEIHWLIRG